MRAHEFESQDLPSVERARQAIPQILARAQRDYDAWDEEDRDTYAGGGICHIIADSVCDVLSDAGIECTSVSCSHEQHVYVAARFAEGIYTIDIPYHVYEQGGGFSWKKLPDVRFEPRDVVFYRVSGDPADWRDYLDEGLRDIVNYIRNIGSEQDAPIVMMTNPQNTGARTASGQRMRIEDFPLRTVAVSELKPWEPMIKMRDLPSQRTVASLVKTLRQGGRIPPLLVTPVRGGYRIIDGHHRYAALQRAGIEQAPVRVVDPRLIRYSDEIMEALKITLERYGHLAVKEQAGEEQLGSMIMRWQQVTPNKIIVQARSGDGSEELGSVEFYRYDPSSKKWTGEALHVAERYRRQGVATAMYDWFRQKFGPIRPSDAQTRDGKSFWQGKRMWEQGVTEAQGKIKLGPQLFVSRQTTTEDIKPRGVAWTSTAQKTPQGFTSDWVEWCKDNMAQWVTDTGILYDVAPGARILLLRTDRDVIRVARRYGLEIKNSFDLFEKMDWDVLRQDYDAVHHIPQGRDPFMSAWDVESTAWFDRKFLTNPRRVTVDTGKTHNVGETGKPGVAESLDQPYRIKWERSPFGDLDAIATLEDGSNLLIMFNNEADQWRVEFYRGDRQDITGEGDAQRIFATVLKAIREFIRRKKPPSIVFGSVKEIDPRGSRTRLYDRMVQRYANDLGYTLHRQQDSAHTVYHLNRDAQTVAEGIDPDTFEELDARIIARAAKRVVPTARARRTPEGYVHVTTPDGLDLYIGASVADGVISVNIGSGGGVTTSGAHKGAVTDIIRGVYHAAVRKYGEPDTPGELTIDHDAGHGVWQHIADKLGLRYVAVEVKESGMAEGRISDLDIDLQDQQWEAVVGRVEHGVRRGEDSDRMSLALYQWAAGEMFDMDEELERRGFGSVADLADHIRDHGGRYVPPEFDLGAAGSIKDIQRLPRRRPDDVLEVTSEPDFMRGHCHVMALALLTLHPDWQLRAHIGWDEDAESDNDYRVDHVYVMAPDGTAYDCRGRFASEQELVGPDETGGAETQFVDYDISRMRADVARGELRPFSRRDLKKARAFAQRMDENFADGKIKGKSRPGRVRRAGASCKGSVTDLRARAKKYGGERGKMYHWCANMKSGKKNK